MTDFKPCERTVRMCIEALPARVTHAGDDEAVGYRDGIAECYAALETLLPDPAEDLVREWRAYEDTLDTPDPYITEYRFAQWLLNTGRITQRGHESDETVSSGTTHHNSG